MSWILKPLDNGLCKNLSGVDFGPLIDPNVVRDWNQRKPFKASVNGIKAKKERFEKRFLFFRRKISNTATLISKYTYKVPLADATSANESP